MKRLVKLAAVVVAALGLALVAYLAGAVVGLEMTGNPDEEQRRQAAAELHTLQLGATRQATLERLRREGMDPRSRAHRAQGDRVAAALGLRSEPIAKTGEEC